MARYNQGLLGSDDSEHESHPFIGGRWFKVALIPPGLFLLAVVSTFLAGPKLNSTSEDGATSLVGLAPSMTGRMQVRPTMLRSGAAITGPATMAVQAAQNNLRTYGIGSSPLETMALNFIDRNSQQRDVSMQAKVVSGWDLVDAKTKERLVQVIDEVEKKEQLVAGVSAPMNYFDPLGLSTTVNGKKLLFYREVELKHGRVAMLAALGILVGENFHPLFGGNIDVPAYLAFQQTPLQNFWPAVVAAISIPELFSIFQFEEPNWSGARMWEMKANHQPGDLGFDPLGLKPEDPAEFRLMQEKELSHCRLAMIAAAGFLAQEAVSGETWGAYWGDASF